MYKELLCRGVLTALSKMKKSNDPLYEEQLRRIANNCYGGDIDALLQKLSCHENINSMIELAKKDNFDCFNQQFREFGFLSFSDDFAYLLYEISRLVISDKYLELLLKTIQISEVTFQELWSHAVLYGRFNVVFLLVKVFEETNFLDKARWRSCLRYLIYENKFEDISYLFGCGYLDENNANDYLYCVPEKYKEKYLEVTEPIGIWTKAVKLDVPNGEKNENNEKSEESEESEGKGEVKGKTRVNKASEKIERNNEGFVLSKSEKVKRFQPY
jgi:hypothetical protein